MNAKLKKEFTLTIGTNDENATEEDLVKTATMMESAANGNNPSIRVHIFDKEDDDDGSK